MNIDSILRLDGKMEHLMNTNLIESCYKSIVQVTANDKRSVAVVDLRFATSIVIYSKLVDSNPLNHEDLYDNPLS